MYFITFLGTRNLSKRRTKRKESLAKEKVFHQFIAMIEIIFCFLNPIASIFINCSFSIGITLIEIPYWWNHSIDDLRATIVQTRPDLLPLLSARYDKGQPIPKRCPPNLSPKKLKNSNTTTTTNEATENDIITQTLPFSLYQQWTDINSNSNIERLDFAGWWISRRLTNYGIRAIWNGQEYFSLPNGRKITPPSWYIEQLVRIPVEGQLM